MFQCPICDTEYLDEAQQRCTVCGWDLTPIPGSKYSKVRKAFLDKQQAQIDWARKMWVRYQVQQEELQHKPMSENLSSGDISRLESRFDELKNQFQQAREERAYLQSQLEWVSSRLEQVNLEQMQEVLWQVSHWLNSGTQPDNSYQTEEYYYPSSEVGIDYSYLMNLLSKGKWKKADEETWAIALKATVREEEGWLTREDLANFPTTDLASIDWLWEQYSYGRFGLRVQQQIWESVDRDYTEFCDRVGWRVKDNWLYYDELNFSLDAATGHLPAIAWRKRACYGVGNSTAQESLTYLFQSFPGIQ